MTLPGLRKYAVAALAAVLGGCTWWHGDEITIFDETERNFRVSPNPKFSWVGLEQLRANPSTYKLMEVQFDVLLNRVGERIFVPFYSTFRQEDHIGFSAWAADAPIWMPSERVRSLPTLYVRKDSASVQSLLDAGRFAYVRLKGRVMGDFEQIPFIEIVYVEVLESQAFTEESLADLGAAMESISAKRPAQAIQRLEAALQSNLIGTARALAHFTLGRLYEERGDHENAALHYEATLWDDESNVAAWDGWQRSVEALEKKRALEAGRAPQK
jgi:tetratricopeptide (TPR) repeat protein